MSNSGHRRAWMKIDKQIPQCLKINQTQTTIYVQYFNQPQTYNTCGNVGHMSRRCTTQLKDFKHLVDVVVDGSTEVEEGYLVNDSVCNDAEIESFVHVSMTNTDVYIDPSQKTKYISCSECDYKCTYEHIMEDHMQTHTGENPFVCPEGGQVSGSTKDNGNKQISRKKNL